MNINLIKWGSILLFGGMLNYQQIFKKTSNCRIDCFKNCEGNNIDSLKWMMYALNFDRKAMANKNSNYPELNVVECDLNLYYKDSSITDTVVYYFSFFKDKKENIYIAKSSPRVGIGFSCKSKKYFPVSENFFPEYLKGYSDYDRLFDNLDKKFINYLKNYHGRLSVWLRQEAIKREIL
jgi:hypothetical protein